MPQQTMNLMRECIPIFTVLGDENRHQILRVLWEHGRMNVNELTEHLHLSRPAVSHHLKIMLNFAAWLWIQMATQLFSFGYTKSILWLQLKTSIYEVNF